MAGLLRGRQCALDDFELLFFFGRTLFDHRRFAPGLLNTLGARGRSGNIDAFLLGHLRFALLEIDGCADASIVHFGEETWQRRGLVQRVQQIIGVGTRIRGLRQVIGVTRLVQGLDLFLQTDQSLQTTSARFHV